jgi:hypothetical protein
VIAARLSEDPSVSLPHIEAGPGFRAADSIPEMLIPDPYAIVEPGGVSQYF